MAQNTHSSPVLDAGPQQGGVRAGQAASQEEAAYPEVSPLVLWLIWSGVGMMVLSGLLLWTIFGPSIFVDLATAAVNCF